MAAYKSTGGPVMSAKHRDNTQEFSPDFGKLSKPPLISSVMDEHQAIRSPQRDTRTLCTKCGRTVTVVYSRNNEALVFGCGCFQLVVEASEQELNRPLAPERWETLRKSGIRWISRNGQRFHSPKAKAKAEAEAIEKGQGAEPTRSNQLSRKKARRPHLSGLAG
jgi:hypothetical protein